VKQTSQPAPRSVCALLAILAGIAILGSLPASAAAAPIKLGVYYSAQGQVGAPEDPKALDSYAAMVGRKPDIVMDYSNITDPLLTKTEITNLQARGETPLVTWQLYKSGWGGPTIPLQDIAAGKYDSYLRQAATAARSMPFSEIMIRFAHEMNGDWYGWSGDPSAYVEAWRRVVTVFREENATNVRWIWSPNVDYGSYPFKAYFPGDSWVDYVALDGYNWGTTGQGANKWQGFSEVFTSSYNQLTQMSAKPVMIAETSSSETGGSKAAWIRESFLKTIPSAFPRIAAVIWFSRDQEDDWRIDSSTASLEAYRDVVASTLYGGTVAPPPPAEKEEEVVVKELEVTPEAPASSTPPPSEPAPAPPPSEPPPPASEPTPTLPSEPAPTAPVSEPAPISSPAPEPAPAPAPEPVPAPTTTKQKKKKGVFVRGKAVYRVSARTAAVRFAVTGPGIRGMSARRSLTIYNPKRRGRVPLARLVGGRLLKNKRYRVVARAVSRTGNVSKPRHDRFRVTPKAKRRSRRAGR